MVADTWLSGPQCYTTLVIAMILTGLFFTTNIEAVCIENPIYFLFCLPCS